MVVAQPGGEAREEMAHTCAVQQPPADSRGSGGRVKWDCTCQVLAVGLAEARHGQFLKPLGSSGRWVTMTGCWHVQHPVMPELPGSRSRLYGPKLH